MTLSKKKYGHLIHSIIEKCAKDNRRYRNDFKIFGDHVEVYYFVNKTNSVVTMLLDRDIWEQYHEHFFHLQGEPPYVNIYVEGERVRVHRLVMNLPARYCDIDQEIVYHLDRNTLDNRRSNLKIVDYTGNARSRSFFSDNDSGVSDVTLTACKSRWRVRFARENKIKATVFDSLSDAVEYRYKKGKEIGFHFREGSTTIENYINKLKNSS